MSWIFLHPPFLTGISPQVTKCFPNHLPPWPQGCLRQSWKVCKDSHQVMYRTCPWTPAVARWLWGSGLPEHDFAWFCSSRSSTSRLASRYDVVSNWIGTCKWEFWRMMYGYVWHYDMEMMAPAESYIVRILAQLCLGFRVLFARKGKVMQKKHASRLQGLNQAEDSRPRAGQSSFARLSYERGHLSCQPHIVITRLVGGCFCFHWIILNFNPRFAGVYPMHQKESVSWSRHFLLSMI